MFGVVITKNGVVKRRWNENKYEDFNILLDLDLFAYWGVPIEIDGTLTLADLIKMFHSATPEFMKMFEMLTRAPIRNYMAEAGLEASGPDDLEAIEIFKSYEINDYGSNKNVYDIMSCNGVFKTPYIDPAFPEKEEKYCAIDFVAWNELKNLPIKIKNTADITMWNAENKEFKKYEEYEVDITLGEFFIGLFDELCFFGSPGIRDEENEKLKETIKRIEDGTEKCVPWEEVKERLERKIK